LIVILLLVLVTLLMLPVSFGVLPAVTSGFSQSAQEHVGRLLPWLMPLLVLTCLASYCAGILNAEGRFGLAAFVPAITPLCVALALLALPALSGSSRLAIGTMTGALLELGFVILALRILGFRLLGAVPAWSGHWRQVSGQFLSMAGASTLMALTMFVDQSFAARLDVGSVSVLSYGTKLGGVTASMLVVVVSTLALPVMSRMAAADDWQGMQRTLLRSSAVLLVVTVAVALILAVASRPIIEMLFLHGAFTATAAENAARVQFFHAWHIPFYVLGTVALRVLVALRLSHIAVIGSGMNLATNIVTNIAAAPVLGVAGVALATTTMYAASCMFLSWFAVRELQRRRNTTRTAQG
jgi:putative peptidoglycan lipid II flippase